MNEQVLNYANCGKWGKEETLSLVELSLTI